MKLITTLLYFVQTNYSSCCSYLKYHFPTYLIIINCDPFWHTESDVARAEYLVSPIMP